MVESGEYLHEYEPKALYGDLANKYLTGEFNQYSVRSYKLPFPEEYASYMDSIERRNQLLKFHKALSEENLEVD